MTNPDPTMHSNCPRVVYETVPDDCIVILKSGIEALDIYINQLRNRLATAVVSHRDMSTFADVMIAEKKLLQDRNGELELEIERLKKPLKDCR